MIETRPDVKEVRYGFDATEGSEVDVTEVWEEDEFVVIPTYLV